MAVSWLNLTSGKRSAFLWLLRREDNELFSSGPQSFSLGLRGGPVLSVLWALEGAAMVAMGFSFCRREALSKALGEILQEKVYCGDVVTRTCSWGQPS